MSVLKRALCFGVAAVTLIGCGGDSGSGTFAIKGKLATSAVSIVTRDGSRSSGTVTHIMAVDPSSGAADRRVAALGSDGSFTLDVTPGKPYILVFIDSSKTGKNMILGMFKSNTLDTLAPAAAGSADLGTVSVSGATSQATISTTYDALLAALGIDATTATTIGALDDVCLRYVNPDIDGDGQIDALQSNRAFILDFHVRYDMQKTTGVNAKVEDIIGNFLSSSTAVYSYTGTGVYAAYQSAFSSSNVSSFKYTDVTKATITTSESGSVASGATTTGLTTNEFGNYKGGGPNMTSASELASGTLEFVVGSSTLTFTNVVTPTLAQISAGTDRIMPFIKIVPSTSSCTSNCAIASIDYEWRKKTAGGWVAATLGELAAIVNPAGGYVSIKYHTQSSGKSIGAKVPMTSLTGSIAWNASSLTLGGSASTSDITSATTRELCNPVISYDDQLGMRYFSTYQSETGAAGGC